jgi:hypothetical protein
MANSDKAYERLDRGIRSSLALWAESDREKKRERAKLGERKFKKSQEKRQQQEFNWKKEDREKKQKYEILLSELATIKALKKAGKERLAGAKFADVYNKQFPDGDELIIGFRSDAEGDMVGPPRLGQSRMGMNRWNTDPQLKGKDIAAFSKQGGALPFKNMDELINFAEATLTPKAYLDAYKESEAKVAEMNLKQEPFQDAKDGLWYKRSFKVGMGGLPEESHRVPYEGKRAATKEEQVGLKIKAYEKETGIKLTPAERKEIRFRIKPPKKEKAVAPGKERAVFPKDLALLAMPLIKKLSKGKIDDIAEMLDADEELSPRGIETVEAAVSYSLEITRKKDAGEKLTAEETKDLPHARHLANAYKVMQRKTSVAYPLEEKGDVFDWKFHDEGEPRTELAPRETERPLLGGRRPPVTPRQSRGPAVPLQY